MGRTLEAYLEAHAATRPRGEAVAALIRALALGALEVRDTIDLGALGAAFAGERSSSAGGDIQKDLDVIADDVFLGAVRSAGVVALYASEELEAPVVVNRHADLALAIDPLDGSSNIDTNVTVGTIFSVLPVSGEPDKDMSASFLQPGSAQLAAGFFLYGPQLALVLTVGAGTSAFIYSRRLAAFVEAYPAIAIPTKTQEFAINASNYRHWDPPIRAYVDECFKGATGAHGRDYNMRWIASMVADAYRILMRGGIYLYPVDARKGYSKGRLRLVYEAAPLAMLVEQAGGAATDGMARILDQAAKTLHQRTPLVFGSANEVEVVAGYHIEPNTLGQRSPLFGNRGLFRN
jgi:fructose-1,6-bisphosphatase I